MNFTTYLIKQLTDIVDVYRKYLKTTYATCLAMTVCCFVIMAFLVGFGDLPQLFSNKQPDLITYFLTRYSTKDTYRLVDLSKIILLFFISLLSMSISKFENMENLEEKKNLTKFYYRQHIPLASYFLGMYWHRLWINQNRKPVRFYRKSHYTLVLLYYLFVPYLYSAVSLFYDDIPIENRGLP